MANTSFRIDLTEVETAAKLIRSMLDDLETPTNHLEAVVKQIQASVYGSDLLGKALQGGGSSVGGLAQHQEQVLAGIRQYMQNSAAMAQNLLVMVERHRATDDLQATELMRILDGSPASASPTPVRTSAPLISTVPVHSTIPVHTIPATAPTAPVVPDAVPVPAPAPVAAPDPGFQAPPPPNLHYNTPPPEHEPAPHGGGHQQLI